MGQAFYRKYRSKSLSEVIGQEHITETLSRALKSGRISHAYLFTGPKGVGKTSVARILAHEVNNLPYTADSTHLDIIEIDAASNRRIDEIRQLRDKVHITPTSAKYKVYIIDEVHMLTREAFNALLKTLEEPPAHCIFILATTEAHKLPETIISRTQRFSFKPIDNKSAVKHLEELAKKEKISITKEALKLLAEHGQGSFRDSISLLEQLSAHEKKITENEVRNMLGVPPGNLIIDLINHVSAGDGPAVLASLEILTDQGANPIVIANELSKELRSQLIEGSREGWVPRLLNQLLEISSSTHPREKLEICLLEAANNNSDNNIPPNNSKKPERRKTNHEKREKNKAELTKEGPGPVVNKALALEDWPQVVAFIKDNSTSIYTVIRLAKPEISNDVLTLYFQFSLHQKKLNQIKHREAVARAVTEVTGAKVRVMCLVDKELFKDSNNNFEHLPAVVQPQSEDISLAQVHTISNIFGTAEVLES